TRALSLPTTAQSQLELLTAARECAVYVLRKLGPAAGRSQALAMVSAFAGRPWADAELDADVAQLDLNGMWARVGALASILTEQGKERLVSWSAHVAGNGGMLGEEQCAVIEHIAAAIGMTAAHASGVIAQAMSPSPNPPA